MLCVMMDFFYDVEVLKIFEGMNVCVFFVNQIWEQFCLVVGDWVDEYCDVEIVDSFDYILFFNFYLWGVFNGIVYCFCFNGNDYCFVIMECIMLGFYQGECLVFVKIYWFKEDEIWLFVFGFFGKVFD